MPSSPNPSRLSLHDALPILLPELRMKIWQMAAALEGRFFQPIVEPIRLGFADSAVQGQLGLSPSYATFQWTLKPLILRVVCREDRKSTRLNSSHVAISYAVFTQSVPSFPTRRSSDLTPRAAHEDLANGSST